MTEQPERAEVGIPPDPLRLLGLKDVASILGTSALEVREWIERGDLPCVRVGRSQEARVSRAMLAAWQDAVGRGQLAVGPGPPARRRAHKETSAPRRA